MLACLGPSLVSLGFGTTKPINLVLQEAVHAAYHPDNQRQMTPGEAAVADSRHPVGSQNNLLNLALLWSKHKTSASVFLSLRVHAQGGTAFEDGMLKVHSVLRI